MNLKGLTTNLFVTDMDRSLAFYRDLLGLPVVMSMNLGDNVGWSMLSNGSATLMLQTVESVKDDMPWEAGKPISGSFTFHCDVENVDDSYGELAGKAPISFEMRETSYGAREFGVHDPDGYSVTLSQMG